MPNIGPLEIVVVLIIALVVFGPKRLPELGRSMGKGMREFKDSLTGKDDDDDDDDAPRLERSRKSVVPDEVGNREPGEDAVPLEGEVVHEHKN